MDDSAAKKRVHEEQKGDDGAEGDLKFKFFNSLVAGLVWEPLNGDMVTDLKVLIQMALFKKEAAAQACIKRNVSKELQVPKKIEGKSGPPKPCISFANAWNWLLHQKGAVPDKMWLFFSDSPLARTEDAIPTADEVLVSAPEPLPPSAKRHRVEEKTGSVNPQHKQPLDTTPFTAKILTELGGIEALGRAWESHDGDQVNFWEMRKKLWSMRLAMENDDIEHRLRLAEVQQAECKAEEAKTATALLVLQLEVAENDKVVRTAKRKAPKPDEEIRVELGKSCNRKHCTNAVESGYKMCKFHCDQLSARVTRGRKAARAGNA